VGAIGEILVFKISWEMIEKPNLLQSISPQMRLEIHSDSIHRMIIPGDQLISAARDRTPGFSRLDQLMVNKVIRMRDREA
jgi:hypothetical protein